MGEVARFWGISLREVEQMSSRRYRRHLDHFIDYLDIQQEAYERAKSGDEDGEEV